LRQARVFDRFSVEAGDIVPFRSKVVQRYPWEKDKDGFLFREDKEKQGSQYLVCIQIYVTTPDSSSVKWYSHFIRCSQTNRGLQN